MPLPAGSVRVLIGGGILSLVCGSLAWAQEPPAAPIDWFTLLIGLLGGLALFLYGMEKMSAGMKKAAGTRMRAILAALTHNRVVALIVGAFVTMVIQSSSATTVMLVSFVQAELMTFAATMGVILGADIGTTVTAQLIAFKLTDYALLMVAAGFALRMLAKQDRARDMGDVVLGFGILFFGMKLMSDAMTPLRTYPEFIEMMRSLENPIWGLLVGTLFTALVQSSSATTGVVIVLSQQGLITLEAGIPLIFGANVGTCITAALASLGTGRDAKRVALAHVLFKIAGVALFIFWIPTFAEIIRAITMKFNFSDARQIANAHTLFNVTLALIFLPFCDTFARLVLLILPDRPIALDLKPATRYLDETMLATPEFAIDLARAEISRMANLLQRMLQAIIHPFLSNEPRQDEFFPQLSLNEGLDIREAKIDYLDEEIAAYLVKVVSQNVSREQGREVYGMLSILKDLEGIGDIIHRNMMPLSIKKQALESDFSAEGKRELVEYHTKVCKQISRLRSALGEIDHTIARKIIAKMESYLSLETEYRNRHMDRFVENRDVTVRTHEVHMELMDLLKQINIYTGNIAKTFVNTFGQY